MRRRIQHYDYRLAESQEKLRRSSRTMLMLVFGPVIGLAAAAIVWSLVK